jgi:hypothetical protein
MVTHDDQSTYERLIPLVEAHAQNGVVLALRMRRKFPSSPAAPTNRALFEFFDERSVPTRCAPSPVPAA